MTLALNRPQLAQPVHRCAQMTPTVSILGEFLRSPMTIGAIAASSRALASAATTPVTDGTVVELGPGTGAMTACIQERLAGRGRHLAVEVNPRLATTLADRYPTVEVITADAAGLSDLLTDRDVDHADVVVSGLPWAAFAHQQQVDLLDAVLAALPPAGVFTTFAYVHSLWTPAARRFNRELRARFGDVVLGRTQWRNLPPALVYYARNPRAVASAPEGA